MSHLAYCEKCHQPHDIDALDGKPTLTWWLKVIRLFRGQLIMLHYAADHGYDFDRIECATCYGPGYVSLNSEGR